MQRQGMQLVIPFHPMRKVQRDYDRVLFPRRNLMDRLSHSFN